MKNVIKDLIKTTIPNQFRTKLRQHYSLYSFFGFKHKCPFCNSNLKSFLPHGLNFPVLKKKEVVAAGFRENVLCPKCGSYDRERLLYLFLIKKTKLLRQQTKLLHVAPEDKLVGLLNNQNNIDYLTADLLRKNVMVNMDITDIQYPDNSFDAIICNHVLEHVPDDQKAMTELFRVLKPNGWAVLQVPISYKLDETFEDESIVKESDKEIFFGQEDHVRIYAADYFERLQSVGFKLEIFDWRTDLKDFGGEKNLFGLNKNEKIFFVTK